MYNKAELCNKIHEIYPEMGHCDQDLEVGWNHEMNVWEVSFEMDGKRIKHYLEDEDAASCLEARQCLGVGIEFGQFR